MNKSKNFTLVHSVSVTASTDTIVHRWESQFSQLHHHKNMSTYLLICNSFAVNDVRCLGGTSPGKLPTKCLSTPMHWGIPSSTRVRLFISLTLLYEYMSGEHRRVVLLLLVCMYLYIALQNAKRERSALHAPEILDYWMNEPVRMGNQQNGKVKLNAKDSGPRITVRHWSVGERTVHRHTGQTRDWMCTDCDITRERKKNSKAVNLSCDKRGWATSSAPNESKAIPPEAKNIHILVVLYTNWLVRIALLWAFDLMTEESRWGWSAWKELFYEKRKRIMIMNRRMPDSGVLVWTQPKNNGLAGSRDQD